MRALFAIVAFVLVATANYAWWWLPNRPVEIPAWKAGPLQAVSFAPYRPGQSPLTRSFPNVRQIEADLQLMQGKATAPSFAEILALLPADRTVVVSA